jgi:hypothetical protein
MKIIFDLLLSPLGKEEFKLIKISDEAGVAAGSKVVVYNCSSRVLDVFDRIIVRSFSNSTIHVELETGKSAPEHVPVDILRRLFYDLGADSNGIEITDIPSMNPFGAESYGWCLNESGRVVNSSENPYCCLDINWQGKVKIFTISNAQNLGFKGVGN